MRILLLDAYTAFTERFLNGKKKGSVCFRVKESLTRVENAQDRRVHKLSARGLSGDPSSFTPHPEARAAGSP
jgi:hypothetical protein